jgi:hypothetical protein
MNHKEAEERRERVNNKVKIEKKEILLRGKRTSFFLHSLAYIL